MPTLHSATPAFAAAFFAALTLIVNAPPAAAEHNAPEALEARIAPVGKINIVGAGSNAGGNSNNSNSDSAAQVTAAAATPESIYQTSCALCHTAGIAGAPKLGDAAAWESRLARGVDALIANAINGVQGETGVMPARGGNVSLSDAEVEAAVRYMLERAQ